MKPFFSALLRSRAGLFGWTILTLFIVVALAAPWLGLHDPIRGSLAARLQGPTWSGLFSPGAHPLGTDQLGRDILSRIIYGSRATLAIAGMAVILGGIVGVILGIVAGYFRGLTDTILMRLVDIQLALPLMLLALLVVAAFGPSMTNLVIVLALTSWIRYARIVRGQVLAVREREFVLSTLAIGASTARIMFRHILPNIVGPLVVAETLAIPGYISTEAFLSFIGLGVNPPTPSWGAMISDGAQVVRTYPNQTIFPALALAIPMFAFNFLGDGLRDALDPRLRGTQ